MVTSWDDYPVHQTSEYIAHPATSDRNFYDRCIYQALAHDGQTEMLTGLGVYPNLGTIDERVKTVDGIARANFVADSRSGQANIVVYSGGPAPSSGSGSATRRPSSTCSSTREGSARRGRWPPPPSRPRPLRRQDRAHRRDRVHHQHTETMHRGHVTWPCRRRRRGTASAG